MKEENEKRIHGIFIFASFIFEKYGNNVEKSTVDSGADIRHGYPKKVRRLKMNMRDVRMSGEPDKPHEECGVFGMYDLDGNDVASTIYYGLLRCSTEDRKVAVLQYQTPADPER